MKYILKEMTKNELPRSKLKKFGVRSLSDYELLAVIIKSGIKEKSVLDISIEIMNYFEKDQMLKLAFRSYTGSEQFAVNMLYKQKSVIVQASRMVLQAVGRMCRTFVKNPNIYMFVESELLDKIYVGELKKRILPPEMKVIVDMREKLGKDYLPEENIILNKELISKM